MFGWLRRNKGADQERERMGQELAHPSTRYTRRAQEELEAAARMSEEEVREATDKVERDFLRKLVSVLSRLNRDVALRLLTGFYALKDPNVPMHAKAALAAVLLYFINPFDLIPDITPVVGLLDDAGVLAGAWMYLAGFVSEEHRSKAEDYLAEA